MNERLPHQTDLLDRRRPRARRRHAACVALLLGLTSSWALGFGFDTVMQRAQQLAAAPYHAQEVRLPNELQGIDYDHFREIRFKPERALWRDAKLPFEIAFFHLGLYYDRPVRINEIGGGAVHEIHYDPAFFDYGTNKFDPHRMRDLGFAGFRVHY